ncbi:hypothetical protein ABVK25_003897 [Lepraria finkii]|uniref:Uncharacterized protein n=1 Tax=Lepraria finkii TaxID=1340010 RepID=A0ABR4BCY7_9LECA
MVGWLEIRAPRASLGCHGGAATVHCRRELQDASSNYRERNHRLRRRPLGEAYPDPFHWCHPPNIDTDSQQSPEEESPKPPQTLTAENEQINVINGHAFKI